MQISRVKLAKRSKILARKATQNLEIPENTIPAIEKIKKGKSIKFSEFTREQNRL